MTQTWNDHEPDDIPRPALAGYIVFAVRASILVVLVGAGLLTTLILRPIERWLAGTSRPLSPWVTQGVCRASLWVVGLKYRRHGQPMRHHGASVANHSSWLDIFALNASRRLYFVSKAEVAGWPGIGWLARATGTVFIRRTRREASLHVALLRGRMRAGHHLLFFPEGTSTDGLRVLEFKPTLFAAFIDDDIHIQPVTVLYKAPVGEDPRIYGWWGDMDFGPHLLSTLARLRQGSVDVTFHEPVAIDKTMDRKDLAKRLETVVRNGLELGL